MDDMEKRKFFTQVELRFQPLGNPALIQLLYLFEVFRKAMIQAGIEVEAAFQN
jgi:hypothetical protein